ncbi:rhomboid family intramembrane serine protease [Paenibacillus oenotherae]|uniref:Rhomboid family intramembrane serine protease n=2 Tax=Paenibacillus oenotherae TaxID=1435645 RepID=A0ABS7D876_9BACL|nr:rhomboid family intramembrane serine protease [Paenibacillus oenotherae]MBW7476134.1 rhomboid family intramembrane serine protease [Paenibacillus oenotherae]
MIFLRYESFREYLKQFPVTAALIAVNILVFIIDLLSGHTLLDKGLFYSHPEYNPYGMSEPWRYITAVFLHQGFEHLFFNMIAILIFAPPLERMLGHVRYGVFFIASGMAGFLLSGIVEPITGGVGASGGIYGLYGAYFYLAIMKKALDPASRKTVYMILIIGLIMSVLIPGIGFWGHIGGLFAGFLFAYGYDWYLMKKR